MFSMKSTKACTKVKKMTRNENWVAHWKRWKITWPTQPHSRIYKKWDPRCNRPPPKKGKQKTAAEFELNSSKIAVTIRKKNQDDLQWNYTTGRLQTEKLAQDPNPGHVQKKVTKKMQVNSCQCAACQYDRNYLPQYWMHVSLHLCTKYNFPTKVCFGPIIVLMIIWWCIECWSNDVVSGRCTAVHQQNRLHESIRPNQTFSIVEIPSALLCRARICETIVTALQPTKRNSLNRQREWCNYDQTGCEAGGPLSSLLFNTVLQFSLEGDLKRWQEKKKGYQTERQQRRLPHEFEIRRRRTALFYFAGIALWIHDQYWSCRSGNPPRQNKNTQELGQRKTKRVYGRQHQYRGLVKRRQCAISWTKNHYRGARNWRVQQTGWKQREQRSTHIVKNWPQKTTNYATDSVFSLWSSRQHWPMQVERGHYHKNTKEWSRPRNERCFAHRTSEKNIQVK